MKDMNCISVELADRIHKIMMERAYLKEKLFDCERELSDSLVDWAKEATGVHIGHDFYFKGRKAILSFYIVEDLPNDFEHIPRLVGAAIRLEPETTKGPTFFEPDEISVKDFQHQEVGNNGGNDDRKD